jgi:hypothetical protein
VRGEKSRNRRGGEMIRISMIGGGVE